MKKFRIKDYEIQTEKLTGSHKVSFAVLADLHGFCYGRENKELIQAIRKREPDAVLVAGDMLVRTKPESMEPAVCLLKGLAGRYPVYYALGNHESKMFSGEKKGLYLEYEKRLKDSGVRFLHNEQVQAELGNTKFCFHGLELPLIYYHKPRSPKLKPELIRKLLGTPSEDAFHVLLAHNPKYGNAYFSWGADLILSGHFHGGVLRLTEHMGLTSPQYLFLPPYCCGDFHRDGRHMIVSAGLGEHTIPIRIHNPRELLFVTVKAP